MAKKTKDLFKNKYPSIASMYASKNLTSASLDELGRQVESPSYIKAFVEDRNRFKPNIDFSNPSNFVKFGSAAEYYKNTIENIYKTYPYDGSLKEKYEWHNSSSYFDNYFFEYEYPRTNGYISIGQNWTTDSEAANDGVDKIVAASSPQYISMKGGPNGPQAPAYDPNYEKQITFKSAEQKANFYNSVHNQKQNLTIDGTKGNTVEFWLKLPTDSATGQNSPSYAYFDLWNESTDKTSGGEYGRFLIETRLDKDLDGTYTDDSLFHITYMSGTTGAERAPIGPTSLLTSQNITLSDWNHYAFVIENNPTGSDHLLMQLYINGTKVSTVHTGSQVSEVVKSPLNANIGAYRYNPASNLTVTNGEGSISGSYFDEFRFWKTSRNQKQIGLYWFTQVGGGTNTDVGSLDSKYSGSANIVDLGVYYKFNEGIVGSSQDAVLLDYSGRVSNGTYNNYSAVNSMPSLRSTSSAMVEAGAADRESKDPIIYSNHPTVANLYTESLAKGVEYDVGNSMALYNSIPMWILDNDSEKNNYTIKKLTQIMGSYFDELHIQTGQINKLKDEVYISGSVSGSAYKPLPFANRLLESRGFMTSELFSDASILEALANRDDVREFKTELVNVKNQIYTNIYNNLNFITKAKGTEKSIRNLLRCYGLDDNIYALSFYANNADITLNQSVVPKTVRKNYVNFATASHFNASVYQSTASSATNESMYITGSGDYSSGFDTELGFTLEAEVIFPIQLSNENPRKSDSEFVPISASLFGMHTVPIEQSDEGDTTWSENDYANFQVYAVREFNSGMPESDSQNQVKFVLTGTNVNASTEATIPYLTSSTFYDVYENEKWNFAVKVYPTTYPNLGIISGTSGYTVEFQGFNANADIITNQFTLTGSVTTGANFLASKKRVYIGSHRTNYTGSLIHGTNVRMSSCRYWTIPLETSEIISHAIDATNYGIFNPEQSAYLFQNYGVDIPKIRTLALNWDFAQNTGTNASGEFTVQDFSSGSGDSLFRDDLSNLLLKQHTGRGVFFGESRTDAIKKEKVFSYKQQVPENLDISDTIRIINKDQEFFNPRTRPVTFSFSAEKSMYQAISEEMLNFLACSAESSGLENLVGDPVNKYRQNYKMMQKVRSIFFEKISNTPDLDKYLEYYKWLDGSVEYMIDQLVPASSLIDGVRNIVESHVLERNKYTHKFPTFEFSSNIPEGTIHGIQELKYDWEFGHAPIWYQASCVLNTTTPIILTNTQNIETASSRNGNTLTIEVQGNSDNDGDEIRVWFLGTSDAIILRVRPNDGTNNGGVPVELTTEELVELINTGAVSGKTINLVDSSSLRQLQTATGGDATNLADGGEGDGEIGTFAGGTTQATNCNWWNKKVDREDSILATGITDVDVDRAMIHSASLQVFNRKFSAPYSLTGIEGGGILKTDYNKKGVVLNQINAFDTTNNITFNTTTIVSSSVNCTDDTKINPNLKRKADYQVELSDNTNTKTKYSSGLVSPYSFYSASIDRGVPTGIPTGYQAGPDHLRDYYVDTKDVPMQGPFTERHVGGYAYRHVGVNTTNQQPKPIPQAWFLVPSPVGSSLYYTIYNPSFFGSSLTRADFSRETIAKRPVNIKNIQTNTSSVTNDYGALIPLGNYVHNYEIVQIADRSVNNRYFVENNGILAAPTSSTSVFGLKDYEVPDRGRHASIMVNRFSAPGGPEINSAGFLDFESETYSVYNALPFRNLTVRQPLKSFLTAHSLFGGYSSLYGEPSASYHKVQRNGAKRILSSSAGPRVDNSGFTTGSEYDNYWVQHMIPRSDLGYSWITASATNVIFGYEQPNLANASLASTDITFVTSSEHVSYAVSGGRFFGISQQGVDTHTPTYSEFIETDFVGINSNLIDTLDLSTNTVTSTDLNTALIKNGYIEEADTGMKVFGLAGRSAVLNAINLRRNGAGGFSSWKQVRQSYHPIVRNMVNTNTLSVVTSSVVAFVNGEPKTSEDPVRFIEPSVLMAHKPLRHHFILQSGEDLYIKNTYANNVQTFSNKQINSLINFEAQTGEEIYDDLKRIYIDKVTAPFSPIQEFVSLKYREIIYPRKINSSLAKVRGRENYTVSSGSADFEKPLGTSVAFWKDSLNRRMRTDNVAKNLENMTIHSSSSPLGLIDLSVWPLDAEEPFYDYFLVSASAGDGSDAYDPYYWSPMGPSGAYLDPTLEPRWNNVHKNGELSYAGWLVSLYDLNLDGKYSLDGLGPRGPLTAARFSGVRVTASIQYEYPNLVWSGSFPYGGRPDQTNPATYGFMTQQSSASLHLIPPYRADVLSGRRPWFDSYEEYANDIRFIAKDYTIIPEFRISEHMDYYIENGFKSENNKFLSLVGSSLNNTSSAASETGAFQNEFFTVYSNSDFMSKFAEIKKDHKKGKIGLPTKISLKVNAVKKLLPYQGFYPALRAVQLGALFSSSYAPYLTGSDNYGNETEASNERLAALYQPFFAPGIFFNTIKSGIAVDYSVHTGSVPSNLEAIYNRWGRTALLDLGVKSPYSASNSTMNLLVDGPNYSFPFEAILNPDRFLPTTGSNDFKSDSQNRFDGRGYNKAKVYFAYPHFTGSLSTTADPTYADPWVTDASSPLTSGRKQEFFFVWKGQSKAKYSLAANNFFAEVENFFLEKRSPVSFVSQKAAKFKPMFSGSVYVMDVVLSKTDNFVSYEGPSGSFQFFPYTGSISTSNEVTQTNGDTILGTGRCRDKSPFVSARGMHYGPPYLAQPYYFGTPNSGSAHFEDPCFAVHTPPYFYGDAVARIEVRPHEIYDMSPGESIVPELSEILANAQVSTKYFNTNERAKDLQNPSYREKFPAGQAQMQISSSVDLFGTVELKQVEYSTVKDPQGNFIPVGNNTSENVDDFQAWVIESKFECPSINMANMDVNSLGAGSGLGKEKFYTRGIWKGYGTPPTQGEGIYLSIKEPDPLAVNFKSTLGGAGGVSNLTGSLIDVCGFEVSKQRVGEIASSREISEAIVAIPMNKDGNFYEIDPAIFLQQLLNVNAGEPAVKAGQLGATSDIQKTSISEMIQKMKKYYLPPQLDALNNGSVAPIVMYIFEFTHNLTKTDLSYIWQNLMPDIAMTAEKDTSTIQHRLDSKFEFFGSLPNPDGALSVTGFDSDSVNPFVSTNSDVKWMVFKVKQRGKNNYNNVTKKSERGIGFSFTSDDELASFASSPNKELPYSYNWPYDFFSLVELAQVEAGVTFEKTEISQQQASTASPIGLGVDTSTEGTTTPPAQQPLVDINPAELEEF